MDPKTIGENLQVELAVVKLKIVNSPYVINSSVLTQIIQESAAEIGMRLEGTLISVMQKFPGPTAPTTQTTMPSDNSSTVTQTPPVMITTKPGGTTTGAPTTQSIMPSANSSKVTQTPPMIITTVPGTTIGQVPVSPGVAAASEGGDNGGVIGGVVVAVLIIIILAMALAIWYFR